MMNDRIDYKWEKMAARIPMSMLRSKSFCGFLTTKFINSQRRTLFSAAALGLDGYLSRRETFETRFKDLNSSTFRDRMKDHVEKEESLIFTEDLKAMVHLVRKDDKNDIDLFKQMCQKYCSQNQKLRFTTYVFGPVIMRLFYFLNKPDVAFELIKNPETQPLFDQFSSYLILMNSYFKQEEYERVLEVFKLVQDRQLLGTKYPKDCVIVAFAACYQINTKEAFDFVLKVLEGLKESGSILTRRAITFAAALAIKQGNPAYAVEILSLTTNLNYFTIRNLMMMAFSEMDRLDEVFLILKAMMKTENLDAKEHLTDLFPETFEKIESAIDRSGSKEKMAEFAVMQRAFHDAKRLQEDPFNSFLMAEITPKQDYRTERFRPTYAKRNNLFLNKSQMHVRKGLMELED